MFSVMEKEMNCRVFFIDPIDLIVIHHQFTPTFYKK
jgi:hypothetical protein